MNIILDIDTIEAMPYTISNFRFLVIYYRVPTYTMARKRGGLIVILY